MTQANLPSSQNRPQIILWQAWIYENTTPPSSCVRDAQPNPATEKRSLRRLFLTHKWTLRLDSHTLFKRNGFPIGAKYLCLSRQYFTNTFRKINTLTIVKRQSPCVRRSPAVFSYLLFTDVCIRDVIFYSAFRKCAEILIQIIPPLLTWK